MNYAQEERLVMAVTKMADAVARIATVVEKMYVEEYGDGD